MQCCSPIYTFPMLMLQHILFSSHAACTQNMLILQVCLFNTSIHSLFPHPSSVFFSTVWVWHGSSMVRFLNRIRPAYRHCHNSFSVIRTYEIFLNFTHCWKSSMHRPSEAFKCGILCHHLPPGVYYRDILQLQQTHFLAFQWSHSDFFKLLLLLSSSLHQAENNYLYAVFN